MDAKAVDRALRDVVRPALRQAGFERFAHRSAWRQHERTVDVVVVRSFNAYIAAGVGCTTFSFAVSGGILYRCITDRHLSRPKYYESTFQFELGKSIRQPWFHPYAEPGTADRPDVWYVLPDGTNLADCVADASAALHKTGLPLIDRFTVPELGYAALLTETSRSTDFGIPGITMPGNPDSPHWRNSVLAIGHLVSDDPAADLRTAPVRRAR